MAQLGRRWSGIASSIAVITAAVVVFAFAGYVAFRPIKPPSLSAAPVPAPVRVTSADEPVMVVLGDSFTGGSNENSGPEWPEIIGQDNDWIVFTEAVGGSGYVSPGQGEPFGKRVPNMTQYAADLILVAGGINDIGRPTAQIAAAAGRVLDGLVETMPDAQVAVVSPFVSGAPSPATLELSAALRRVAAKRGLPFIDATRCLAGGTGLIGADHVHPTDKGHQRLADCLDRPVTKLLIG